MRSGFREIAFLPKLNKTSFKGASLSVENILDMILG
jgi:hypothetical protein